MVKLNQCNVNFHNSIVEFIGDRIKQPVRELQRHQLGNGSFNRDMNTFYFKMPRQCGNSMLSVALAETFGNSCFLFAKEKYARNFMNAYPHMGDFTFTEAVLESSFIKLRNFEYVFVEIPSTFDEDFIDELWANLTPKFFIFIG